MYRIHQLIDSFLLTYFGTESIYYDDNNTNNNNFLREIIIIVIIISLIGHVNCVGKRYIYWNGPEPRLCLTETELIKEFLSKYSTVSGKSWLQKQGSKHFIGEGVLMANGENWYNQRHIVAPAFMGDRLKVLFNHTHHGFGFISVTNNAIK